MATPTQQSEGMKAEQEVDEKQQGEQGEQGEQGIKSRDGEVDDSVLQDMMFYAKQFCRDAQFDEEKQQVVLSIAQQLWDCCVSTTKNNAQEATDLLQSLLLLELLCQEFHMTQF